MRDLTQTIDARFDETFKQVAHHFSETVGTLFPGGNGRLRLTDDVVEAPARLSEDGEEPAEDAEEQPRSAPNRESSSRCGRPASASSHCRCCPAARSR